MQHIVLVAAIADARLLEHLRNQIARQDEIVLLGEACDAVQMLRVLGELHPDVLLLDAAFFGAGLDSLDSMLPAVAHCTSPATKILLLADHCGERLVARTFEQGARGRVSSIELAHDCLRAIRAVNRGDVWIGRMELALVLLELLARLEKRNDAPGGSADRLSERELQIADAVGLGLTNKEIARKLHISDTTVKTHIEHIFHKLKVSRRVQLAILTRPRGQSDSKTFEPIRQRARDSR